LPGSQLAGDSFEHLHDIGAAECEARFQRRREPRKRVDDREHAQLAASGQLVMHEIHCPGLV
jgi:hypothetical protein